MTILIIFITECKADIAFVIDSSGSIKEKNKPGQPDNWETIKLFTVNVVNQMEIGPENVRVAATTYSTRYLHES